MKTVCRMNACTGCRACIGRCSRGAIVLKDSMKNINAVINENLCLNCGACTLVCPNNTPVEKKEQILWKQGWAKDNLIRMGSASGGVASALILKFIADGGYVCSCLFENGDFTFKCTNDIKIAKAFAGSKYVKSNLNCAFEEIKDLLLSGAKVLFIALPCQVAGLLNFLPKKLYDKLYTVDLICHGTPSIKLFENYLIQKGIKLAEIVNVTFRQNAKMGIALNSKSLAYPGTVDRYLISFLNAINYTDCCYECQYAVTRRVADITLGDSWGSDMSNEMESGVSLITVQTEKGIELLEMADLELYDVNKETALKNNGNLLHPSVAPESRDEFFLKLQNGEKYDKLVMKYFPKQTIRQIIKQVAIRAKLLKIRGGIQNSSNLQMMLNEK